ncbi:MAG: glutamate-cysteine ligase family protein [Crenarchaeota archaeon]|nr:glutamate-cysteine ligase family protein [Thermoproteota archaeon]
MLVEEEEPITIGVEIECYTILSREGKISRRVIIPNVNPSKAGERFTIDKSIGTEYVSTPFESVREALQAISSGLEKYADSPIVDNALPLPVGGWNDRFAGTHFHVGFKEKGLSREEAGSLASYIHDHIPFIIAVSANSPVWRRRITPYSSNRLLRGGGKYCIPITKGGLNQNHYRELNFNPANKHKPSTLELRVCDSNIPPYVCTVMTILRILALAWRNGRDPCNSLPHEAYLKTRVEAARRGAAAKLYWNGKHVTVSEYLTLLLDNYSEEVGMLDVPKHVVEVFNLLGENWNNAETLRYVAIKLEKRFGKDWERSMAFKLASAMKTLLGGGSLKDYHEALGLRDFPPV